MRPRWLTLVVMALFIASMAAVPVAADDDGDDGADGASKEKPSKSKSNEGRKSSGSDSSSSDSGSDSSSSDSDADSDQDSNSETGSSGADDSSSESDSGDTESDDDGDDEEGTDSKKAHAVKDGKGPTMDRDYDHDGASNSQNADAGPSASTADEAPPMGPSPPPASFDSTASSNSGSSSSGPRPSFGWAEEVSESAGSAVKAITSREDMAELLSTEPDSPLVGFFMVLLTTGIMAGLYGTVRAGQTGATKIVDQARVAKDAMEVAQHLEAVVAAGLNKSEWMALEAHTFRKLLKMDAHTVAFWMGADVASIRRWQAGRTLAQDVADGLVVPEDIADDASWRSSGSLWSKTQPLPNPNAEPTPAPSQ